MTYLNGAIGGVNKQYEAEKFKMHQGFIAELKDNFGFIETLEHDHQVFFHFSNFIGNTNNLKLGEEVEFSLLNSRYGIACENFTSAGNVRLLPKGTINHPKVLEGTFNGAVVRPLRNVNSIQEEYSELIQLNDENGKNVSQHKFRSDFLQKDDCVVFKIDETSRAVEKTSDFVFCNVKNAKTNNMCFEPVSGDWKSVVQPEVIVMKDKQQQKPLTNIIKKALSDNNQNEVNENPKDMKNEERVKLNNSLVNLESIFVKVHSEGAGYSTATISSDKNVLITTQKGGITYNITMLRDEEEEKDILRINMPNLNVPQIKSRLNYEEENTQYCQEMPIKLEGEGDGQQLKFFVDENSQNMQPDNHILTTDAEGNQILVQGTNHEQLQHLLQSVEVDGSQTLLQLHRDEEEMQMTGGDGNQGQIVLVQDADGESQPIDASMVQQESFLYSWSKLMGFETKRNSVISVQSDSQADWNYTNKEIEKSKPFWTKQKDSRSTSKYKKLFKVIADNNETFIKAHHFSINDQGMKTHVVLYIPGEKIEGLIHCDTLKLYVHHHFIMDNCEELIPDYLNFMKGVVDSEDLPLNISREMLQQNKILKVIRKNLVKKCMELFEELTEDKEGYKKFYSQFSNNLKLGVHEDSTNRSKLADLLRFQTSASGDEMCSLAEYVERMKESQKQIYFITGKSKEQVRKSIYVDRVKKRGFEVIYMIEPIDEYVIQHLKEYQDKTLVNVSKEGLEAELPQKKRKQNFESLKHSEIEIKRFYNLNTKLSKKEK